MRWVGVYCEGNRRAAWQTAPVVRDVFSFSLAPVCAVFMLSLFFVRCTRFMCAACETCVRFDALACAPCTHRYVCNAHFTWVRAGERATCAGHVRGRAEIAQRFACAAYAVLREDAPHPLTVRAAARFTTGARAAGGLFRLCPRNSAAPVRDALRKCRSRW